MKKTLGILGIDHPDTSKLLAISDFCKIDLITGVDRDKLIQTATEFDIPFVVTEVENDFKAIDEQLWQNDTKTYVGEDAIAQCCENENLSHIWINYNNFKGLKAAVFGLKTNKVVGISNIDLLFQCGRLLREIATENHSFVSSTDSEFNFFYKNIINYDLSKTSVINISFSVKNDTINFKKAVSLFKILPDIKGTEICFSKNSGNISLLEIQLKDGEIITHQKECAPFSILNQWFGIPFDLKKPVSTFQIPKNTPLHWSINEQWYKNDAFAIAFMAQKKNWTDFQSDHEDSSFPKISSLQDVKEMLTNSSRTDLDS